MLVIIITIIFATIVAYFATQNTASVIINISQYSRSVPLYLVVLLSILIGFIFAWILHLLNAFTMLFTVWGKDKTIEKEKKENIELKSRVRDLEKDKARLEKEKQSQSSKQQV